jgi:hypothetical protein
LQCWEFTKWDQWYEQWNVFINYSPTSFLKKVGSWHYIHACTCLSSLIAFEWIYDFLSYISITYY